MITISKPLAELIDLYNSSLEFLIQSKSSDSVFMVETNAIITSISSKIYGQTFYCKIADDNIKDISLAVNTKYYGTFNVGDSIRVIGNLKLSRSRRDNHIYVNLVAEAVSLVTPRTPVNNLYSLVDKVKTVPNTPTLFPFKKIINLSIIVAKTPDAKSTIDVLQKLYTTKSTAIRIKETPCDLTDINEIIKAVNSTPKDADVLAIVRGGGNAFDISLFDNINLYNALSNKYMHKVLGIGHTNDRLILEMAADYTAQTPSDLADYILENVSRNTKYFNAINQLTRQQPQTQYPKKSHKIILMLGITVLVLIVLLYLK